MNSEIKDNDSAEVSGGYCSSYTDNGVKGEESISRPSGTSGKTDSSTSVLDSKGFSSRDSLEITVSDAKKILLSDFAKQMIPGENRLLIRKAKTGTSDVSKKSAIFVSHVGDSVPESKYVIGVVIAVGNGVSYLVDDIVLAGKWVGLEVSTPACTYVVLKSEDVIAKVLPHGGS